MLYKRLLFSTQKDAAKFFKSRELDRLFWMYILTQRQKSKRCSQSSCIIN